MIKRKVIMEYPIVQSSPESKKPERKKLFNGNYALKYPFAVLERGQSFTIPLQEANIKSLQALCRTYSKEGKRFIVVLHEQAQLVEVARTE
jgi:hypothetical protein